MKKIIFLNIILIFISYSFSFANIDDIENHWAKENINRMIINGNISGYPDNTFRPNNEITKLEFLKMLFNTLNINLVKEGLNEWPDYYINTAKKYNIIDGYDDKITRYEATDIISKIIDLKGVTTSNNKFKDLDNKYKTNVLKLNKLKIINGYDEKTFGGDKTLTRAEAVTIVLRTSEANRKIISEKKYKIDSNYTNIGNEKSEIDKIRYEIKGDKILFTDEGRFSNVSNYSIEEKYITNKKLINIIQKLVSEDSYTAVYYVPNKYIINQVIIKYGQNDNLINRGLDYFSFTYYEDKLYDLARITLNDNFSNECYLKIELKKLWNELYDLKESNYIDTYIENKLLSALKVEFGSNANSILEYLKEKYIEEMTNEETAENIAEKITIGKYIINCYKTDATSLEFYFEKLSSN